ncbi:cytoglobin-1-like [Culicoides brevitarsis]|uniref:cytoglobin-1-like n=1 Tax=Culicoides brevitarsis TaxID=469753 RepID=UPI00307BB085
MASLTESQIAGIVETWKIPSQDLFGSGEYILYEFLSRYPHNQEFFKKFRGVPLDTLKGKASFRAHASRIMNRFSATVDCLQLGSEGLEEIQDIWRVIGESHSKHKITREAFKELEIVVVGILCEVCNLTEDQKTAWATLLQFCYDAAFETLGDN